MSLRLVTLLCLLGMALAMPFSKCGNSVPPLERIAFGNCEDFPCRLKYKSAVKVTYQLTMPHTVTKIDKEVWWKNPEGKFILARIMNGCDFVKCPVAAGQTVRYSKTVAMPDNMKMGLHEYEIHFKDGVTKESLACGRYQVIFYDEDDNENIIIHGDEETNR